VDLLAVTSRFVLPASSASRFSGCQRTDSRRRSKLKKREVRSSKWTTGEARSSKPDSRPSRSIAVASAELWTGH
jgi:hypothetical protein